MDERRIRRLRLLTLVLALIALGLMLYQLRNGLPGDLSAMTPAPPSATPTQPGRLLPTEVLRTPQAALTLTGPGPSTPADDWSNRLLDQALPLLSEPLPTTQESAWWQTTLLRGELAVVGGRLTLGGQPLELGDISTLSVLVPSRDDAGRLLTQGTITWEDDVMVLSTTGSAENGHAASRWRLSRSNASLALRALVIQAEQRDQVLTAAYIHTFGREGQLVLISAMQPGAVTPTPTRAAAQATPLPTFTPSPTATATPTRVPEAFMGQVIAEELAPVIAAADDFPQRAVDAMIATHPWTGLLTWTETGARIGGLPVVVQGVREMTFYTLQEGENGVEPVPFLTVVYDGSTTRFPEQQVLFMEHRMDEVLYWMVRAAADEGGQLVVAFDDFGARQTVTILDFRPYRRR